MSGYKDTPLHQTISKSEADRVNAFWAMARYRARERFRKSTINLISIIAAACLFGWAVAEIGR